MLAKLRPRSAYDVMAVLALIATLHAFAPQTSDGAPGGLHAQGALWAGDPGHLD